MIKKQLNIGVITRYVENSYFGAILKGIQDTVKKEHGRLFIFNTYMLDRFRMDVKGDEDYYSFSFNHIDAWIILLLGVKEEYTNKIINTAGKPVVIIGNKENNNNCTFILDDSYNGAKQVVEHFLSHGHKKIAYVGTNTICDMVERHLGYKEVLDKYGLYDESIVYDCELPMPEFGKATAEDMIKRGIDFTAIFAANDYLAFGLIEGLKEANIDVPKDIAVIGYDNSEKCRLFRPALSSMNQNTIEIGREAGNTVFRLLKGEDLKVVKVKSDLVIRESCGCQFKQEETDITENNQKLKESMIDRLEDVLYKNSDLGTKFFTLSVSDIIKTIPQITDEYKWFCFGLFQDDNESKYKIVMQTVVDKIKKITNNKNIECDLENFPPIELLPIHELDENDVILVLPISTEKKNIGIMAYITKIHEDTTMFVYDMNMVLYNFLGIALDRSLAMTDLQETLESLKKTQEQLIESEKLASLGSLVAGVAHEINNPIGIGVTAATYLQSVTLQIKQLFETNKLTKSELIRLMGKNNESVKILLMNLQKASNLIRSFKQVATDNTIDEKRVFKVKDYLNDVILSLSAKLKMKGIKPSLECPEDLQFYCNPGEISQVFTNLILNSIIHGYDEDSNGEISIKFEERESSLVIEFKDNGKGIEKAVFERIFDPFFTTKNGSDGSGLGLTIVRNIIEQKFGGTIQCESDFNKGARFIIHLPLSLISKYK